MPDRPIVPKPDKPHLELLAAINECASALSYLSLAVVTGNETLEKILARLKEKPCHPTPK
ncbi:MAG: hypothetical protein AAB654_00880 [Acidobacteriota bacterium]